MPLSELSNLRHVSFSQVASADPGYSGHTCLFWQTACVSTGIPIVTHTVRCNVALVLIVCGYHV